MSHSAHDVAAVFGRAAHVYDTVVPFFAEFGARLVDAAGLRAGEAVVDVGSGRGAALLPAAERVAPHGRAVGVDLSPEMVALLAGELGRRGLAQASVIHGDAEALRLDDGEFDVALASFVLHLLPDPARAAAELHRVVAPGGRCAVSAPSATGPGWEFLGRLFGAFAPRAKAPVALPFRPDFDLAGVVAAAGFAVAEATVETATFAFADEHAWWDWAWSHGMRSLFEVLDESDLAALQREAFVELEKLATPEGISLEQSAAFVVATKGQVSDDPPRAAR